MGKIRVTIKYLSRKLGHSRYGFTRRVEEAVRLVEEDGLDDVIDQFRANHEVLEVTISRINR